MSGRPEKSSNVVPLLSWTQKVHAESAGPVQSAKPTTLRGVAKLSGLVGTPRALVIAEGMEAATAVSYMLSPVWCVAAEAMADFPVLRGVCSLIIYPADGPQAMERARLVEARWRAAGRKVGIFASLPMELEFDADDEEAS